MGSAQFSKDPGNCHQVTKKQKKKKGNGKGGAESLEEILNCETQTLNSLLKPKNLRNICAHISAVDFPGVYRANGVVSNSGQK